MQSYLHTTFKTHVILTYINLGNRLTVTRSYCATNDRPKQSSFVVAPAILLSKQTIRKPLGFMFVKNLTQQKLIPFPPDLPNRPWPIDPDDDECHKQKRSYGTWTKKQKRAYHRIRSGDKVARILKIPIKHLVLTTSPQGKNRNLSKDFQILRKRILRRFHTSLPYCKVNTNESNGVMHVLIRTKTFLPQRWLSAQWLDIHKSSYIWIKQPPNDVARYVVTQYIPDQGSSFARCSWSHTWVCKGFVKAWYAILHQTRDWKHQRWNNLTQTWTAEIRISFALNAWDKWLSDTVIKQTALSC